MSHCNPFPNTTTMDIKPEPHKAQAGYPTIATVAAVATLAAVTLSTPSCQQQQQETPRVPQATGGGVIIMK